MALHRARDDPRVPFGASGLNLQTHDLVERERGELLGGQRCLFQVELNFRDAGDVLWHRDYSGLVTKLDTKPRRRRWWHKLRRSQPSDD